MTKKTKNTGRNKQKKKRRIEEWGGPKTSSFTGASVIDQFCKNGWEIVRDPDQTIKPTMKDQYLKAARRFGDDVKLSRSGDSIILRHTKTQEEFAVTLKGNLTNVQAGKATEAAQKTGFDLTLD